MFTLNIIPTYSYSKKLVFYNNKCYSDYKGEYETVVRVNYSIIN